MQASVARGQAHWILTGIAVASVLGLGVLRLFTTPDPRSHSTHEQLGLPACWMMKTINLPCPGCGVTTAASLFVHGDWRQALAAQPFGVLLVVGALTLCAWTLIETARGKDAWEDLRRFSKPWMYWSLGVAMLAAWGGKIAAMR